MKSDQFDDQIRKILEEHNGEFRPCAFYNDRLGELTILVRDCSLLEHRIDRLEGWINVFEDNYPGDGQTKYIGLSMNGYPRQLRLLTKIFDSLLASADLASVEKAINEIAEDLLKNEVVS